MSTEYRGLSILGDPFECPDCGVACEAVTTTDPQMGGEYTRAWWCPSCEAKFYREVDDEVQHLGTARSLGGRLLDLVRRDKD